MENSLVLVDQIGPLALLVPYSSGSSLNFFMTALSQQLQLDNNVYQSQLCPSGSLTTLCTPCSRNRKTPDVWKDQAELTAVSAFGKRVFHAENVTSAIAKAGNVLCKAWVLRLLCLQGFRMTHGRACPFSGEENRLWDFIAQDKIMSLRSRLEADQRRGSSARCLFSGILPWGPLKSLEILIYGWRLSIRKLCNSSPSSPKVQA